MKKTFIFIILPLFLNTTMTIVYCDENENSSGDGSIMALPVITYTTDTGVGVGAAVMKTYNPSRIRISDVRLSFIYTQKKQVVTFFGLDHFLKNNTDRVSLKCEYSKYPIYFYGMGNNTSNDDLEKYTPEYFNTDFFFERRFKKNFRVKTKLFIRNQALVKYDTDRLVHTPLVPWGRGRFDAGPGISLLWDTRDNLYATRTGTLAQVEYMGSLYQNEGGAFNSLTLDLRHFIEPSPYVVLGSMFLFQDTCGDVPFYKLSVLGGYDRLRGYEDERYRARSLFLYQQDFRYPIWGPVGGAVFIATGRVAGYTADLFSGRYHTAAGAGLRYYYNREENLVIRFDYARGSDSRGVYISFGEAF